MLERKKEIGILRAIGASKGNISQVFNAETFIIGLTAGLIAAGGTMACIIPPSIVMVVYAQSASVSVGDMFLGGVAPGLLTIIALIALNSFFAVRRQKKENKDPHEYTVNERMKIILDALLPLLMPVAILGGVFSGLCTATEAAVVAVVYALFLAVFVYRESADAVVSTGVIMLIISVASPFGWLMSTQKVPQMFASWLMSITDSKFLILAFIFLLLMILLVTVIVLYRTMRPLYALLRWLDGYTVGARNAPLAVETSVTEFRKLNDAARRYAERAESSFERQKQFIGNASHEMQTPLAVCRNRLEMLVDDAHALTGEQLGEIAKVQRTLDYLVRLNRSLLLLSKIDNGQFPEAEEVDVNALVRRTAEDMEEIYAYRSMRFALVDEGPLTARMNPSLAGSVVANLLKNAFVHGDEGGEVTVRVAPRRFTVCNSGAGGPLDAGRIFDRFYQGTKKEGSTGLGLAVVDAVCRLYGLKVSYSYKEGRHCFAVDFPA